MAGKLEHKTAIITGSGSGIGRAMAKLFADNGCHVVAVDVIPERIKLLVEEIGKEKITGVVRDLSSKSELEQVIDDALKSRSKIDILCNNAGIMDSMMPVAETSDELWEKVMNVNLNSPFWACRRMIPSMIEKGGGKILNTASIASLFGGVAGAAYTVSKHGLLGLTKSIAAHYGDKGIRCNAMVLGAVQTNIGLGSLAPSALGMEVMRKSAATMPRPADPEEIAKFGLFLVSDDSNYMNGSCVVIDNGWTAY
jgi:NAD(P)-dependent dehydrogenase (short-subunit alcohol dehydrogenase family)